MYCDSIGVREDATGLIRRRYLRGYPAAAARSHQSADAAMDGAGVDFRARPAYGAKSTGYQKRASA